MTRTPTPTPLAPWQFDMYVDAEIDGDATPEQLEALRADPVAWRAALAALLHDAEEHLASARSFRGEEREQVVADLESEHRRIADAWARHTGQRPEVAARGRNRSRRAPTQAMPTTTEIGSRVSPRCRSRGSRDESSCGVRAATPRRSVATSSSRMLVAAGAPTVGLDAPRAGTGARQRQGRRAGDPGG